MSRTFERRAFTADLEMRSTATGYHLRGYAARFDSPSNGEVVRSTAFNKTLAERDDVRLLVNHDGVPLARTKSGTLTLTVDTVGLLADAPELDPSNPDVQRLASAMDRQDIDQMSFAFVDRTPQDQRYDDQNVRNIRDVQLFDASVVTYPWYPDTHAELNALDEAFMAIRNGAPLTAEQRALIAPAIRTDPPKTPVSDAIRAEMDREIALAKNRRVNAPIHPVAPSPRRRFGRHPGA